MRDREPRRHSHPGLRSLLLSMQGSSRTSPDGDYRFRREEREPGRWLEAQALASYHFRAHRPECRQRLQLPIWDSACYKAERVGPVPPGLRSTAGAATLRQARLARAVRRDHGGFGRIRAIAARLSRTARSRFPS